MTKSEAIKRLQAVKAYMTSGNPIWSVEPIGEAFDMAIEALQAKTDGDTISRQAALDAVYERIKQIGYENSLSILSIGQAIRDLPSAQLKTEGMKMIIFFKNGFQLVVTCTEFRLDKDIFGNVTGYEIKGISDNKLSYIDWSEVVCVYRDLRGESDE